jgi:hypothetical protein
MMEPHLYRSQTQQTDKLQSKTITQTFVVRKTGVIEQTRLD